MTISKILWLSYLLHDLQVPVRPPFILYCDNISATHMAANPILHARTKHIEVDYDFVRVLVAGNKLKVLFVHSNEQLADIFTKGVFVALFLKF